MELEELSMEMEPLNIILCKASSHPRYGAMQSKNPVAALEIPNKLILLWERKRNKQGQLCTSVSKHSELVNANIQGGKIPDQLSASALETRLQKQSSYICRQHKRLRCGSRIRLEESTTKVLLFEGEIALSPNSKKTNHDDSVEQNTCALQFHGIYLVIIASYMHGYS